MEDYLTHIWGDKGVYTFTQIMSPKMNPIALLEFELAYYDVAVQEDWGTYSYDLVVIGRFLLSAFSLISVWSVGSINSV